MSEVDEANQFVLTIKGGFTLLRLTLQGRQDSCGFMSTLIEVRIRGFTAAFNGEFSTVDLAQFEEQLVRIHTELSGTATLSALDGCLNVSTAIDKLGYLCWEVDSYLHYPFEDIEGDVTMKFQLQNDQSYLPPLLSDLRKALEYYSSNDTQS